MILRALRIRLVMVALIPLVLFANVLVWVSYLAHLIDNPAKSLGIARSMDIAGNVAINGRQDQTFSARAALAWKAKKRWGCWMCKLLDDVVPEHCQDSLPE